ncbi:peptidase [Mariniphaga sediminis]|uniref:Peptidase n=1 Tax=Mariniphaga sediminis TaxID=1628158 RepID=A0A399CYP6_9BACT|nr:peptidase [Mariniphaga sediminis]RIH63190.1 peptidase [Mariniphaga sediminis]
MKYKRKYRIPFLSILIICLLLFTRCEKDSFSDSHEKEEPPANEKITPVHFLSEETFDKLIIEIVYVEGYKPTSNAVNALKTFLEDLVHKSGGITVVTKAVASPGKTTWSLSDLSDMEKNHRTRFPEEKTLAAWFFFADADFAQNEEASKVLGVAYGPTSMAIFEKTIKEFSGGLGKPSTSVLEETVMKHEFGHILGLVNNGTTMVEDHQDTTHGKHCNNEDCLMYYAAEHSSGIIGFLGGGSSPALDAQCRQDLKNNGGK